MAGLPTGSSPIGVYKHLVAMYKEQKISFKHVVTFNMDEYVELPRDHPETYHSFMWKHLFRHIDIKPENVHILDGNASNLEEECHRYEEEIRKAGGIELFLAGIGSDGHIAFNEPGSSLVSRTRIKTLAYETIVANARFFENDIKKVPKMALTVGVGTVMDAREVTTSTQNKRRTKQSCVISDCLFSYLGVCGGVWPAQGPRAHAMHRDGREPHVHAVGAAGIYTCFLSVYNLLA
jgi:glucosamine-6-phosphate isomerase